MRKGVSRAALESRFLHLIRVSLPGCARHEGWPITGEACFERVLLDNACDGVWTDRIDPRAGWRSVSDETLARMVECAEGLLKDSTPIFDLHERSILWRNMKLVTEDAQAASAATQAG